MIRSDNALKRLLEESIAKAAAANPDKDTNPAQSLQEFIDFVEWSSTTLPRFILKLPTGSSLYDQIDQGVDYLYFLLDQPLEALEGKGYYHPSLQYCEPVRTWLTDYVRAWGSFLSTAESWKPEYAEAFFSDPGFGICREWYEDPANWKSFNDFFCRKLRSAEVRPVASPSDASVVVSPVDGHPQGVWEIDDKGFIVQKEGVRLKSRYFDDVADLVGRDSAYADCFRGGTLTHIFLDVNDYHRYHFPVSGTVREVRKIPGLCAGGGVYRYDAAERKYVLDCENPGWESIETRGCVILETRDFGLVAVLPIGMSQICSVNFSEGVVPGADVRKGDELGWFLFGGSDYVILFQQGVTFTPAVPKNSHILMGEKFGGLAK